MTRVSGDTDHQHQEPPSLVIFDCDGVLVDSEPITNREIAQSLTDHGLPLSPQQCIALFVGGTIKGVRTRAIELGANLPDDWIDQIYERIINALADEVEIVPGTVDVLDTLDTSGIRYCVASNGPMRKMEVTLRRTGLWQRLEGRIFSAHTVGTAKPDPGLFLFAADAFRTAPEACVVIEDSVSGARAAYNAGMVCFGYTADTPEEKLRAEGAIPFREMLQLPGLIGLPAQQ